MNKNLLLSSVSLLLAATPALADDWGITAGADYWNTDTHGRVHGQGASQPGHYDDNHRLTGHLRLEHSIPLLPNVALEVADLGSSGRFFDNDLDTVDTTFYYQVFDNGLFGIDLGANLRHYDGDINGRGYDGTKLMAYAAADAQVVGSGLSFFGDVRAADWDDDSSYDYRLGARYALSGLPVNLRAGWRESVLDLHRLDGVRVDQTIDGFFAGAEVQF
ncbi:hypothetical protein C7H85_06645 [Zobellella endophytica]|uniref:TIGR04219 family outer membrane beta-barrel protein n=1 Tax=Zobellella endophytica TaxID=2116700 RepID=A0A2P7R801_9GAMM|nr:TIGR04219 family outer membrane beta-barrel protein [Zobellella endophytica]PSJ46312.1 hypothetical protein C7H85_06645 [Zobellella endophytica]